MIAMQITVTDGVTGPLRAFSATADKLLDTILRIVGYRYRADLKKNYLSGQMLNQVSGTLVRSLVVGRRKGVKHVYLVGSKAVRDKQDLGGVIIRRRDAGAIKLANIFEHAGGYVIEPKKAKALIIPTPAGIFFSKRVEGRARPFMSESARAFRWDEAFEKTTDDVVTKEWKRLGLEVTP
jgi:hypothetical protein